MRGSRNCCHGEGRGVQAQLTEKKNSESSAFYNFTEGSNSYFKENYNVLRFQRGSIIFQGRGVQNFPGMWGPNANFYRTYRICDFPGGGAPHTPLDPHMRMIDPLAISKFSSLQ